MRIRRGAIVTVIVLAFLATLKWILWPQLPARTGSTLHIALAGPMSGPGEAAGRLMSQAAQLAIDEVNATGGIAGHALVLDTFDDQNVEPFCWRCMPPRQWSWCNESATRESKTRF